jgi:ribosomal protein L9
LIHREAGVLSPVGQCHFVADDVESLGERGAVVDVSNLRNYPIPRKLAQPATAGELARTSSTRCAKRAF